MKYPNVIFFRYNNYSSIDTLLKDNNNALNCTINITSDSSYLNKLYNSDYHVLITFGNNWEEYSKDVYSIISDRMTKQWIHLSEINDINELNHNINNCYVNFLLNDRKNTRPIFSIFTTCYNSYHKIERAYDSLKNQILKDWEWVILDDSPNDEHFDFLRKLFKDDNKIRLYKRASNSGNIGNVKNEAVSLCRGLYVLELDHDDKILPSVLYDSKRVFEENEDVGFVYMDFINIYENNNNFSYGDFCSKGYAGYYCQKYNNNWVHVCITPNINNITLSHLVCMPNHPRIWRRDTLVNVIGNYSEYLYICDDLEVILQTAINTKMAKIPKLGYVQYMNDGNNNFSLIRNSEINRIGPQYLVPIFTQKFDVAGKMKSINANDDEKYLDNHKKIWERDDYEHKIANKIIQYDYEKQYCIIGIKTFYENIECLKELYKNEKNDFILLENNNTIENLSSILESNGFDRMKCYTMKDTSEQEFINYFVRLYKSCDNYEIFEINNGQNINNIIKLNTYYNTRAEIINANSNQYDNYLEIGVEYGTTFNNVHFINKIGVDPDPKFESTQLVLKKSNDFFDSNNELFDVIFIDGMHQTEYFLDDFINSMKVLNNGGIIFIDDILPITYFEQLKIPRKHYYENSILKYGEPWTGDIWKVFYYILKNHSENFEFSYFNSGSYRGIGMLKNIQYFKIREDAIIEINNYEYNIDFPDYLAYFL
jgi:glycosyltransferase involved in cell wall biosynthesis